MEMSISSPYHMEKAQISQEELVIEQAKVDPAKFGLLYERYYEQIFRYIYQKLDDIDIAGDVCSQVFLKAMSNIKKYENRGLPFSSWLYRIASNELNQYFRYEKNNRTVNIDSSGVDKFLDEVDDTEFDREEQTQQLVELLREIDEDSLTMIEMRFFEKRSFREIGEILDITENNAKVKVYRLIDKLKKKIKRANN
jgi:RNA polymerase sigma-70 factor (ECF subfamily)